MQVLGRAGRVSPSPGSALEHLGRGHMVASSLLTDDRSSLSPRMSVRYWAIFFCWTTLQWLSMTGSLGTCGPKMEGAG